MPNIIIKLCFHQVYYVRKIGGLLLASGSYCEGAHCHWISAKADQYKIMAQVYIWCDYKCTHRKHSLCLRLLWKKRLCLWTFMKRTKQALFEETFKLCFIIFLSDSFNLSLLHLDRWPQQRFSLVTDQPLNWRETVGQETRLWREQVKCSKVQFKF